MDTIEDVLKEMRYGAGISNHFDGNCIRGYADRIEAAYEFMVDGLNGGIVERDEHISSLYDELGRLREELRATRERRDECEAKMHNAFERVTAAEERERKLEEEIRGLQDEMGKDTLFMQARDIGRANEEIKRLRELVSRLFSKRHEEAARQSEGSRVVIQSLKEKNERLNGALKPVLECEDRWGGHWPFAARAADAVREAQRICREGTNENNEGKEGTDGKD